VTDLIANLRKLDVQDDHWVYVCAQQAADRIEALEAENERLRGALEQIASEAVIWVGDDSDAQRAEGWCRVAKTRGDIARAALAEEPACQWGGGNDMLTCRTCGAEYNYTRREPRPLCPRAELAEQERPVRAVDLPLSMIEPGPEHAPKASDGIRFRVAPTEQEPRDG
jgi:hypothetical protein